MPRARNSHNNDASSSINHTDSRNKRLILNATETSHVIARIAQEIVERTNGATEVMLVGMFAKGVPLASRLARFIYTFKSIDLPIGALDFTEHRDDKSSIDTYASKGQTVLPIDITDRTVILVDDVIHTGRSIRAGLDALFVHGRPARIQTAVLIDRGHRELPIRADYTGKNIPTARDEWVHVCLSEFGEQDGIYLIRNELTT